MALDEKLIIPLYHQLSEELRENIESGQWAKYELIPSETELCYKYQVSRGTVRQAVVKLVQEGLLYRKQGKGTFVAHPKETQQLNHFHSLAQSMEGSGIRPFSSVLEKEMVEANPHVRGILRLKEGEKVIRIVGLKESGGIPTSLETTYLAGRFFPGLEEFGEVVEKVPLYDIITKQYDVAISGLEECFEPVTFDEYEAGLLHAEIGSLALLVKRVSFTGDGVPFEYRKILVRSKNCKYQVKFHMGNGDIDLSL